MSAIAPAGGLTDGALAGDENRLKRVTRDGDGRFAAYAISLEDDCE